MAMQNIEALEKRLWEVADQLRANSGLGSNEYFMPVLGILFLRQAYNRFSFVAKDVEQSLPARSGVKRLSTKDDFTKRRSIFLREESQYEYLASLRGEINIGKSLNHAMELIEQDYESLRGILPKDYEAFGNDLLRSLLRIFNDEILKKAGGDVFGRIYEYFLMKFAMQGAHDNGEFFTPPSIVQPAPPEFSASEYISSLHLAQPPKKKDDFLCWKNRDGFWNELISDVCKHSGLTSFSSFRFDFYEYLIRWAFHEKHLYLDIYEDKNYEYYYNYFITNIYPNNKDLLSAQLSDLYYRYLLIRKDEVLVLPPHKIFFKQIGKLWYIYVVSTNNPVDKVPYLSCYKMKF